MGIKEIVKRLPLFRNPSVILTLGGLHKELDLFYDKFLSDKAHANRHFRKVFGRKVNFDDPKTLNEKIQYLKLYDRKEEYTSIVDKIEAKAILSSRFGEELVVPTLGVWEKAEDVNFDTLPKSFVIKCNHNSGTGMCICHDKDKLDILAVRKKLAEGLKENYYALSREWPYKNVHRRILAEPLLLTAEGKIPNDYKLHYINGELQFIYVSFDREGVNDRCTFDPNWNRLPFVWIPAESYRDGINTSIVPKPESFEKMKSIGSSIASDYKYVRVDFYDVDGRLYIGEITLYHGSGLDKFFPSEFDLEYGHKLFM